MTKILKPLIERMPAVTAWFRQFRDSRPLRDHPKPTPMGFRFFGNEAMEKGLFEPEETALVQRFVKHAEVFINIGANIGYYCCIARNYGAHVVAFEPIERNVRYLLHNLAANSFDREVEVFPLALGSDAGIARIFGGGTGASLVKGWAGIPESYSTLVPRSSLDNVLGSRFEGKNCLILIDVEGIEHEVLRGASVLLNQRPKPVWMVEVCINEHQPQARSINPHLLDTFDRFFGNGYGAWTATRNPQPVPRSELEEILATGKVTLSTHNFLFMDPERSNELLP
jgi:FkbM family methyltransferase